MERSRIAALALIAVALLGAGGAWGAELRGAEGRAVVKQFLKGCCEGGTFFIATMDRDGQPRVRPFGSVAEHEGRLYLATGNGKDVYRQMMESPKVEIAGVSGGEWIRLTAKVVLDERVEAKQAMLDQEPDLKSMYSVDDGVFAVLWLDDAVARIQSFQGRDDTVYLAD